METSTNGNTRGSPREDFLDNDELSFSPVKKRSTSFHDGRLHNANSNSTKTSYSATSYVWNAPQANDEQKSGSASSSKGGDKSKQPETNARRSGKYGDRQKQGAGSVQESITAPDRRSNQTRTGTKPLKDRNSINGSSILSPISSTEIVTGDSSLSKEGVKNYPNGQSVANHNVQTSEQFNSYDDYDDKLLTKSVKNPIRSSTPTENRETLAENHETDGQNIVDTTTSGSANLTPSVIRPHETKHLQRLQDEILKESEDLIEEHCQVEESNFEDYSKGGSISKGKISPHLEEQEKADKVLQSPKLTHPESAQNEKNANITISTTSNEEKGGNREVNPSKSAQKSPSNLQHRASKARSIHIAEPEVYLTKAVSRSESQPHFITSNHTPANSQSPKSLNNQHSSTHDTRRIHFLDTTTNHNNFRDDDDYYDNEPLEKHYIISLQDSDDVIDRLPLSSYSSRGKEGYSGVVKSSSTKQSGGNSSGNSSGNYSQSNLLQELERLRKNNMEMQSVIDQLTEEIKLRDRTINDLESQIQQLSSIITSKHTPGHPSQSATTATEGGGGAAGDTNSINSDFSHMTSLTSSTVPIQPATLYQCTRCEEIFKSIIQFQVHITQCLEQTLFNKDASNMRRSRSAATSRERVRDRDRSRSSSLFPPKSQESINNASNMQSQDSINTATSAATTERPESARIEPSSTDTKSAAAAAGNATTRSISTSALFHGNSRNSNRQIAETSIDAAHNITLSPKGQKVSNLTSSESISKSVRAVTPSSRSVDIKKLPSQPILNYKGSPKYEELWPTETTSQLKHSDSMRDTFGERSFDETASSLRINASFSQQPRPSSFQQNQKNPNGKKIQKSSSDAVYIPKELRPLRPKMPLPKPEEKVVPTASSEFSTMTQPKRSPQHYNPVSLPPRGATLSAYHNSTSPNISPNASIQRSPNGTFTYPNHQPNDRSRPLGPPPPIPKRGEDSKQKASEQANKRSARSRVKDAVKSPFSSIRRRMRSMSSLERIPKNKDIARDGQRNSSKQNSESSWEITNGPYNNNFRPNSTLNIPQGYSPYGGSGPNSLRYSPPQRAASFYGGSLRHPGGFNPAMYRPLPPSPNTRFYNHSYKYSSNEAAAKAFLHGTGTEV